MLDSAPRAAPWPGTALRTPTLPATMPRPLSRLLPLAPTLCAAICALVSPAQAQVTTPMALQPVVEGLTLPVYATAVPDDPTRLVVLEQLGTARMVRNGQLLPTPFLDVSALMHPLTGQLGELGLLGLAFHPDYANNRFFYVYYTESHGDSRLVRYTTSAGNPDVADPGSAVEMLAVNQPELSHNAGMLAFSPMDGMLYVAIGDGGGENDDGPGHAPGGNAQSPTTLLGKLLRLDVDAGAPWIPADNPYVGNPAVLDEIWAGGLRNPWRFSFDRVRGDLWIGDVGQAAVEEIDYQPFTSSGGENYGWRCMQGGQCTGLSGCTCLGPQLTLPVHQYVHDLGKCAIVGGYVYRGDAIPDLVGRYVYADLCTARIWALEFDHGLGAVTGVQKLTPGLAPTSGNFVVPVSFGEDHDGELLVVDLAGTVFRIVPAGAFTSLGGPVSSGYGTPLLTGTGDLLPGTAGALHLTDAAPDRSALLFVSLAPGAMPFYAGTLQAWPAVLELLWATDPAGKISLTWANWPGPLPPGVELVFQWAIDDPSAPQGVALSNALLAAVP